MEALDLPVRLWPKRSRPFMPDTEPGAGTTPGEGLVGRAVVGQDSLDGDAMFRKPGNSALEHTDCGDSFLIRADLGIGETGVVIDDRVNVSGAEIRFVAATLACALRCCLPVPVALPFADEAPAPAIGNVAELRHIDMDQRPRVRGARNDATVPR